MEEQVYSKIDHGDLAVLLHLQYQQALLKAEFEHKKSEVDIKKLECALKEVLFKEKLREFESHKASLIKKYQLSDTDTINTYDGTIVKNNQ